MDRGRQLRLVANLADVLAERGIDAQRDVVTHCQTHHRSGLSYMAARLLGFPPHSRLPRLVVGVGQQDGHAGGGGRGAVTCTPSSPCNTLLPQHALSRLLGACADSRQRHLKRLLIDAFMAAYDVDLADAVGDGSDDYASFNDFFTRRLRPGARPLATGDGEIVSPADGVVSQAGAIRNGRLLQAKGHDYPVADLLGDADFAASFSGGAFATIYLAPRNYHRVHAPCDARLAATLEVPGRLFSVNSVTERHVRRLFARNERLVLRLEAAFGLCAVVLVGAMIVGRIVVAWPDGPASPYRQRRLRTPSGVAFRRGDEVGAFLLGSTVVALFPPGAVELAGHVTAGAPVKMGELLARQR